MSKLGALAGKGSDQISDIKSPYLKIAQDISAEMNSKKNEYMPDLQLGDFYAPVVKKIYGPTIDVIVLAANKNYSFFDKLTFKGSQANYDENWRREPKKGTFTKEGWKVVTCYNYLVAPIINGEVQEERLIFTLKNSDIPHARDWNTQIKNLRLPEADGGGKCPLFGAIWRLGTQYRENDDQKGYYGIGNGKKALVECVGFIPDEFVDIVDREYTAIASGTAPLMLPAGDTAADPTDSTGESDM